MSLIFILSSLCLNSPSYAQDHLYPVDRPFYTEDFRTENPAPRIRLRVVTYNIFNAQNLKGVIADLSQKDLAAADFILLQEATGNKDGSNSSVREIAKALKMAYFFSPGSVLRDQDWGNAILSRHPLVSFKKVFLPWTEPGLQRNAVRVVANVFGHPVQVYSTHFTVKPSDAFTTDRKRSEQFQAIVNDANLNPTMPTIMGGDFNSANPFGMKRINAIAVANRIQDAHPPIGPTYPKYHFTLDHLYVRGFKVKAYVNDYKASGSDHIPIYSDISIR